MIVIQIMVAKGKGMHFPEALFLVLQGFYCIFVIAQQVFIQSCTQYQQDQNGFAEIRFNVNAKKAIIEETQIAHAEKT